MPTTVILDVLHFVRRVFIEQKDIWLSFVNSFTSETLCATSVLLITAEHRRLLTLSHRHGRYWGMIPYCRSRSTCKFPGSVKITDKLRGPVVRARFSCLCGMSTPWIPPPTWIEKTNREGVYSHDYPLSAEQAAYIQEAMSWHSDPPADHQAEEKIDPKSDGGKKRKRRKTNVVLGEMMDETK